MNRCAAMSEELTEVALGRRASEALSSHLEECRACAAELERQRVLGQRMDAVVGALVRVEPPERLLEDITARARSARVQPWSWPRAVIAVGAAIAASVAVVFGLRGLQPHTTPGPSVVALTAWRSPTASLLEPQGSVLQAPLRDVWFDPGPRPSHSEPSPGETHGT
jgi:anti-sigma factor RsiW